MRVGEHVAVLADDEARAERAALGSRPRSRPLRPLAGRLPRDEAAEELEHILVFHPGHLRHRRRAAHRLRGADVDDRVALLFDQPREIRQLRLHGKRERREPQRGDGFHCFHPCLLV